MCDNEKSVDTKKEIRFMDCKELIQLMISKGIVIENELKAIESISNYSYYSIINTYKQIFKKSDKSYKPGTSFNEIYSLYKFDKSLKAIFLKYLLEIESIIKAQISIVFSSKYGIKDYLIEENFQLDNIEDIKKRKMQIKKLINEIKQEIELSNGKHDAITHYINNYNMVPPWVMIKVLSFGEISRFYGLMKQSDRQEIAKKFNVSDKVLKIVLGNLNSVRNICAHDDRLFTYRNVFYINPNKINKYFKVNRSKNVFHTNLFIITLSLKRLLNETNFNQLFNELNMGLTNLKVL